MNSNGRQDRCNEGLQSESVELEDLRNIFSHIQSDGSLYCCEQLVNVEGAMMGLGLDKYQKETLLNLLEENSEQLLKKFFACEAIDASFQHMFINN